MPKKLKKLGWIHGNKARIQTGHKTFDRYCTYLGTGNICGDGQLGGCIRPANEVECNGRLFEHGALRQFDLDPFRKAFPMSSQLLDKIRKATETEPAILYALYHYKGDRMTCHGFILTRGSSQNYRRIWTECTGPTHKSQQVIDWCKDYSST